MKVGDTVWVIKNNQIMKGEIIQLWDGSRDARVKLSSRVNPYTFLYSQIYVDRKSAIDVAKKIVRQLSFSIKQQEEAEKVLSEWS